MEVMNLIRILITVFILGIAALSDRSEMALVGLTVFWMFLIIVSCFFKET